MKTFTAFLLLYVVFLGNTNAQNHRIDISLKGIAQNQKAYLGMYYGNQIYKQDSAIANNGQWIFEGSKELPQGLYTLVVGGKSIFDIVMTDQQQFGIDADTADIVATAKVKGSKENALFYDYQQFMKNINADFKKNSETDKTQKAEELGKKWQKFKTEFWSNNKDLFVAKILKMSDNIEIPEAPKRPDGKIDSTWRFYYFRNHFWDNVDFSDERLARTPILTQKIDYYFDNLTVNVEDSLTKAVDVLARKVLDANNKDMAAEMISRMGQKFETAKFLGAENVFVHILEKYYLTGLMPLSDSATTLPNIRKRLKILKPLLMGKVIPDLGVMGTEGKLVRVHENPAKYKVIYFYGTHCPHCQTSAPKLQEFYVKNKLLGVEVMAIATDGSEESWKEFIKTYKLNDIINAYGLVADVAINYNDYYDVTTTPTIYVIDENKKIIARKIGIEDLEPFLKIYLQNKKRG